MRFAIGLLDSLFGEKVSLEIPTEGGRIQRRTVTRRWLEQMERDGVVQQAEGEVVRVHHIGLRGYEVANKEVGRDISADVVERFRDPQTNDVYAMSLMMKGELKTYFLKRDKWEAAKATLEEKGFG